MTKEYKEVIGMCTYADAIERKSIEKAEYRCFKNFRIDIKPERPKKFMI